MDRARAFVLLLALLVAPPARADGSLPVPATVAPGPSTVVFAVDGRILFPIGCWNAATRALAGNSSCLGLVPIGAVVQLDTGARATIAEERRLVAGPEVDPAPALGVADDTRGASFAIWPAEAARRVRPATADEVARARATMTDAERRGLMTKALPRLRVLVVDLDGRGRGQRLVIRDAPGGRVWRVTDGDPPRLVGGFQSR